VSAPDWLHAAARTRGSALALVAPNGERITYAELDARAELLSRRLRAAGVARGDRVLALLPSGTALVELVHAVPRAAGVLAPLDPRSTAGEALRAAALVRSRVVVAAQGARAVATRVATACGADLSLGDPDEAPLRDAAVGHDASRASPVDLDTPHTIVFTSGTTGRARGVVLSAGNHLASARASVQRLGLRGHDRWLVCLPLHHVGGLAVLLRAAICGTSVVLQRGFAPDAVARALRDDAVTHLSLVPTALRRLLEARLIEPRATALRVLLLGGARADLQIVREARARGWPVAPTYGLTEACSQVATARPSEELPCPGFVGHPLDGTRVRVLRVDGSAARPGESGMIEVAGPTVAPVVLDDGGTPRALAPRGWLSTADLGSLDAQGGLIVAGRADDVIVSGGENVAPEEVEGALLAHPDVADACVAALPDDEWGQVVCAWVVPRRGATPSLEELRRTCAERLARHKLPRRLVLVEELPRTTSGKLRRRALVESVRPARAGILDTTGRRA
jgi:O-succinylbenzoic acid--CoA ligase